MHLEILFLELSKVCRYDEGYVLQDVFACKTCYLDSVSKNSENFESVANDPKLKPHGFCFGCMMVCHEGHDWFELGQKLDFKCDCGNGKMLSSCQLNSEKEDYENVKNNYNQNYFDLYCYCGQGHNTSTKEVDNFMIKCY